jgi:hypothetical protein
MNNALQKVKRYGGPVIVPPILGTGLVYLAAVTMAEYGWALFLLLPFVLGFSSAVIFSPKGTNPLWKLILVGLNSIAVTGVLIMLTAIEGLVCLAMALPITVPLMVFGSVFGWATTRYFRETRAGAGLAALLFALTPILMGFEKADNSQPPLHSVTTTIQIDAPIETVWKNVVTFSRIDSEPEGILNLGFAYPTDARIEGIGVGAVRYYNFTTGPFIEPITEWQEPNLLAFDVASQPAPMIEMTPYAELHAAHLQYIRSSKGQFRLYEHNGKTIVEGTTFYTHDIAPDAYWDLFSDEIIHKIHLRVLGHIKKVSESKE